VVLRSKVRRRRNRQRAAVAAVGLLGLGAALTLFHLKGELHAWAGRLKGLTRPAQIQVEGVPEPLRAQAVSFLEAQGPLSSWEAAERLRERFGWLKTVRARRGWLERGVRFELGLRRPLGRAFLGARPAGALGEGGILFEAPKGLWEAQALEAFPSLEVAGAGPGALRELSEFLLALPVLSLPSPLLRMRYLSPDDGWEARFADGTSVLWGDLSLTQEKAARLGQVVADARSRFSGPLSADLRYFEDGKVLLTPGAPRE